jgi:methylenetetrahydrofolate dehydrogenase (NADP+)/methenyltetrahydrofolate cyclohydrolase
VGRAGLITADMVKPGAWVIDVGNTQLPSGQWVGDVDFPGVSERAHVTPVPGGVGPMTRAMLLRNTLNAAERILGEECRPPADISAQGMRGQHPRSHAVDPPA